LHRDADFENQTPNLFHIWGDKLFHMGMSGVAEMVEVAEVETFFLSILLGYVSSTNNQYIGFNSIL